MNLDRATLEQLDREALIELVLKLVEEVAALRRELDEVKRQGKRQAAPFSKQKPTSNPKRPGRKPGQGNFTRMPVPDPASYTAPIVNVAVAEQSCPKCGGELLADGEEIVTRTDLPPIPVPQVHAWRMAICRCQACGKRVRARHPEVPPDQFGATAHRLGDRLKAAAHVLHYGFGVPVRKLPAIFEQLHGVRLTQSALTQSALKQIDRQLSSAYEQLRSQIATREHLHSDDTGWRIGGSAAWLMGFSSDQETVYQIRPHHGNAEVREVITDGYQGILHTDRFLSYDAQELSGVRQQKCLAHIQRNLRELIDKQSGRARQLPIALKQCFERAIRLWHHRAETPQFRRKARKIQKELTWLLRPRRLLNAANHRCVNELGRHHDRGNLLRFLEQPEQAEPTNNEAERALRGAVIARKVSQCSKLDTGARAHASFASVVATLIKRGASDLVGALCDVLRTGVVPDAFAR